MKTYSGFTAITAENLLLDAGAFFVNYDVVVDTFESAVLAGKLLGATRGGGSFESVPSIRSIEIDGVKGRAKGLQVIDSWEVKMIASVLEVTVEGIAKALVASDLDASTSIVHDILTARNNIAITDYVDNITFIGTKSGTVAPIIIQIYNALNTKGLALKTEDKSEAVIEMEFQGHYDTTDLETPPFKIYLPKGTSDAVAPTVTVSPIDEATAVIVSANVVWTFDEAIRLNDVNGANFFVTDDTGTEVAGALSLSVSNTVVTFDPTANLAALTAYTAIATKNVKDIAGNALASNSVTNFTTA